MNFFMVSKCGEGAGLLKRIQDEGNSCQICIKEPDYQSVYEGILEKGLGPKDRNTTVIFDSSGMGNRADSLRRSGFKVFGSSKFHDKLENDREFGLDFMLEHDIQVPETQAFTEFKDGINFIKFNKNKRFVFKPSGDLPSKLTYSCSDPEDLIHYMKYVEKFYGKDITDFVLQEFIEGKIISSEYYVGSGGFIDPMNHTIEVKKFMNDELGPSTGCAGNLVWLAEDLLCEELHKVEQALISEGYLGPIDINCIVNEKGVFALEWTPRFGLDAMPTWLQLCTQDIGEIISDIANGDNPKISLRDSFAAGVRVTIPPYPIELSNAKVIQRNAPNLGIPIRGFEDCEENCYLYEVKKEKDLLVHSEGTGVIAVISDWDSDPSYAFNKPYDILESCKIPDKQYRTDLREVLTEMYHDVTKELENVRT